MQSQSSIEWKGFYQEGMQRVPFMIQNMFIKSDGNFEGSGFNSSGPYTITGRIRSDGNFNFRLISQSGGPDKVFSGVFLPGGTLQGTFTSLGYSPVHFELRTKMENWNGTFIQDGRRNELIMNMNVSKRIFGIGKDSTGVFLVNGFVDTTTYAVQFAKSYPGQYKVTYQGKMVNNGVFWVINGSWSIGSQQTGEFEIYKEAPNS